MRDLKKVIFKSKKLLKTNGKLILEIGHKQKNQCSKILNENKFYINKISNFKTFVYSIAWEDFKIDSKYLNISETDNVLMITTGGCNILNTLLLNPNNIISCDLSPAQNAILDLKMSAIINLNYDDFLSFH